MTANVQSLTRFAADQVKAGRQIALEDMIQAVKAELSTGKPGRLGLERTLILLRKKLMELDV